MTRMTSSDTTASGAFPLAEVTHLDSLSHCFWEGQLYNGRPSGGGAPPAQSSAASRFRDWCGAAGILIDVAALRGVDALPDGSGVGLEDLEAARRRFGVSRSPATSCCYVEDSRTSAAVRSLSSCRCSTNATWPSSVRTWGTRCGRRGSGASGAPCTRSASSPGIGRCGSSTSPISKRLPSLVIGSGGSSSAHARAADDAGSDYTARRSIRSQSSDHSAGEAGRYFQSSALTRVRHPGRCFRTSPSWPGHGRASRSRSRR